MLIKALLGVLTLLLLNACSTTPHCNGSGCSGSDGMLSAGIFVGADNHDHSSGGCGGGGCSGTDGTLKAGIFVGADNHDRSSGACCAGAASSCNPGVPACSINRPAKITALGYGATPIHEGYSIGQRRLMAMRASKLDAYRALVEEVYGVRITSNSTVSAMIAQQDNFRAYVDAYLRGARVLSVSPLPDGNYETVMEIELSNRFYDMLSSPYLASNLLPASSCGVKGSTEPGCSYGGGFYYAE